MLSNVYIDFILLTVPLEVHEGVVHDLHPVPREGPLQPVQVALADADVICLGQLAAEPQDEMFPVLTWIIK